MFSSTNHAYGFWQRESVAFESMPSLQELLRCCDHTLLVRAILERRVLLGMAREGGGTGRRRAMERRISATLDAMRSLDAERGKGQRLVLLPEESYVLSAFREVISRNMSAALVDMEGIAEVRQVRQVLGKRAHSYGRVKRAQKRLRAFAASQSLDLACLEPRPFSLDPWEDTLATKAWLGPFLRRNDCYAVLASAFWEMTFFGFEYEKAQAEAMREKAERFLCGNAAPRIAKCSKGRGPLPDDPYDLLAPGRSERAYSKELMHATAVLNHNARLDFYDRQIDLACRLEGGAK